MKDLNRAESSYEAAKLRNPPPRRLPYPTMSRPQNIPGFNTGPPKMEFFGPKDYVPELPHLIQGIHMYPQAQSPFSEQGTFLKLEPKPRSLHRLLLPILLKRN